ncbi:hypothetical protein Tco_0414802 [Tanacetum coccineum]
MDSSFKLDHDHVVMNPTQLEWVVTSSSKPAFIGLALTGTSVDVVVRGFNRFVQASFVVGARGLKWYH